MSKAIKKTKSKAKGVSQLVRKHFVKGKPDGTSTTGRRKLFGGKDAATGKHLVPFALKPADMLISHLTVCDLQGEDNEYSGEDLQLKILKDIYPVIYSMKDFKVVEFDHFNTTADALTTLLQWFNNLDYEKWSLVQIESKYKLKVLRQYGGEHSIHIAVDFLSQINRSHTKLHDMIVWALRLVSRYNGIQMFGDWCKIEHRTGEHGMTYEYLLEREEDFDGEEEGDWDNSKRRYNDTLQYYGPNGVPSKYAKLLYQGASLKMFKSELAKFKPFSKFDHFAFPFLQAALTVAETKKRIHDFCDEPWEAGESKPSDYMSVVWSWDDEDLMYQLHNELIDGAAQGCGVVGFCWEDILDDKGNLTENKSNPAIDFCDKMTAFFVAGNKMSIDIKNELNGEIQQSPLPLKKKKNAKLIDIIF